MALIICLVLQGASPVAADSWDDFANNLATDLAPFLSLFGEQITKQYLSESITMLDYFIFAMAPMGILTAVVSAIRVCGSPSLRAFIGRAQEGAGNAEAELCSSTSRDVCELYNNGGVARVFGRPKILEIVVYRPVTPAGKPDLKEEAQFYTFLEYVRVLKGHWEEQGSLSFSEAGVQKGALGDLECSKPHRPDPFAPNLSLNVGIRRKPWYIFLAVAAGGFVLQTGVLIFAIIATYYLRWQKGGSRPDPYACPLAVIGTLLVCSGTFLCAFLIGHSTKERVFLWRGPAPRPASMYWLQPGPQIIGDQTFDAFAYSDCNDPLDEYTISQKSRPSESGLSAWAAVGVTVVGFIMQFIGLRAVHSSISVAQLGAVIAMSVARAALRMQRLNPTDNLLSTRPDQVAGHELDWLALRVGEADVHPSLRSHHNRVLWRFRGVTERNYRIRKEPPALLEDNAASRMLSYRARLAEITESVDNQAKTIPSARNFGHELVEVRETAHRLSLAIESTVNKLFRKPTQIKNEWKSALTMSWGIDCDVLSQLHRVLQHEPQTVYIQLKRDDERSPWKLTKSREVEGLLGLWIWSLKSDPTIEAIDQQDQFTISRATEVSAQRIIATDQKSLASLKMWLTDDGLKFTEHRLCEDGGTQLDPSTVWIRGAQWDVPTITTPVGNLPEDLGPQYNRFFGWYTTHLQSHDSRIPRVLSTPANSSFLSLCTQEVFGSFFTSILDILEEYGGIDIQEDLQGFRLQNHIVSETSGIFVERGIGTREEAVFCIVPPLIPRLQSPSTTSALDSAKKRADGHRKEAQWEKAEVVLRWAWDICTRNSPPNQEDETEQVAQQATIALSELYRWALANEDYVTFGMHGIEWLEKQFNSGTDTRSNSIQAVFRRYKGIAEWVAMKPEERQWDMLPDDERSALLCRITAGVVNKNMDNDDRGQILCSAAKGGWIEVATAVLELGADPDFKDKEGATALMHAAAAGHIDIVEELLKWGAYPNLADEKESNTPLSEAAKAGHDTVVSRLLKDPRTSVDAVSRKGQTPLWWASAQGHEKVVELLLKTDKLLSRNSLESNMLHMAAAQGHSEVIKLLLATGKFDPDMREPDQGGLKETGTPLWFAARSGCEEVVRLLLDQHQVDPNLKNNSGIVQLRPYGPLEYMNIGIHDDPGDTPLHTAARRGHEGVVKLLLNTGKVDPNIQNKSGSAALAIALRHGHMGIFKLLLHGWGTDPDLKDGQFISTPLSLAVTQGNEEASRILVDTGRVDPNMMHYPGGKGVSLLHSAVSQKNPRILRLLLGTKGIKPNITMQEKRLDGKTKDILVTPLHLAAIDGYEEGVRILLGAKGIDPNFKDQSGMTALCHAAAGGHAEVFQVLLDTVPVDPELRKNGQGVTPLHTAARNKHEDIFRLALSSDRFHPDSKDHRGNTPLVEAARSGQETMIRLLLGTGEVDPGHNAGSGEAALPQSIGSGNETVVRLLLETNKVVTNVSDRSDPPLYQAAMWGYEGIVKLLLDAGADPDPKTANRKGTPLSIAARQGEVKIVKLLLDTGKVDPDSKDHRGSTPLAQAAAVYHQVRDGLEQDKFCVAQMLLETGKVDPDSVDDYGERPISHATDRYESIKELLLRTGKVDIHREIKPRIVEVEEPW